MCPGPGRRAQRATRSRPYLGIPQDVLESFRVQGVELEADYRSNRSLAIAHKQAEHSTYKPIDQINL